MNYELFDIDDFLLDEAFIAWAKSGEDDDFWQTFLKSNPKQHSNIEEARQLVLATYTLPAIQLPAKTKAEMWQNIQTQLSDEIIENAPFKTKILPIFKQFWWAAAAIVLVGGWLGWQNINSDNGGVTYEKLTAIEVKTQGHLQEFVNDNEQPLLVNLPDGSSALLQKGGKLSYPKEKFNQEKREIYLSGEAFFEVAKNPEKPFFVYANELITKVLGTSFTIRAFKDSKKVEVVVKTGKVSVFTQDDPLKIHKLTNRELDGVVLLPNQQITLERTELRMSKSLIERPELLTLSAQKLSFEFDDVPFSQVVDTIEKAYGVEIVYDEELLAECRLTAFLSDEPLYDKIKLICQGLDATYEVIDGQIVLHAKGCK